MTECTNATRDLLPEYLHEQLSAADAAAVEQHVATCAECASELALLRLALGVRPRAAAINVAGIVASLPKPGTVTIIATADPAVRALSSAPSVVRRSRGVLSGVRSWRAAAAITVVALGGMSLAIARRGTSAFSPTGATTDSADVGAASGVAIASSTASDSDARLTGAKVTDDTVRSALPVGELADFSDDEIETVIDRLDKWDGAAAADPLPGVPLLPASSGVTP